MKFIKRFILNRPAEKRLAYFYGMIATDEQVWLLKDENGELVLIEDELGEYPFLLPVWPSRSFAEMEAAHVNKSAAAFNMPLPEFLEELLVDIEKDGGAAAIFPNEKNTSIQNRDEIKEMLTRI